MQAAALWHAACKLACIATDQELLQFTCSDGLRLQDKQMCEHEHPEMMQPSPVVTV